MSPQVTPRVFGDISELGTFLAEHAKVGQAVDLIIGLEHEVSDQDLANIRKEITARGLPVEVRFGSTRTWANALQLSFKRPAQMVGEVGGEFAFIPIIAIVGGLTAAGIAGFLGFQVGNTFGKIGDAFSRNFIPLALLTAGTLIAIAAAKRPRPVAATR